MRVFSGWVGELVTANSASEQAAHYVEVYRSGAVDFVVITEGSEIDETLCQPSITNAAENYCPQIADKLGLAWHRCRFIESYPADPFVDKLDPTYDLIHFSAEEPDAVPAFHRGQRLALPHARLVPPKWSPLPLDLAEALRDEGLVLSQYVGQIGVFECRAGDDGGLQKQRHVIGAYDGRRYYTDSGAPILGLLQRVDDEQGRPVARAR